MLGLVGGWRLDLRGSSAQAKALRSLALWSVMVCKAKCASSRCAIDSWVVGRGGGRGRWVMMQSQTGLETEAGLEAFCGSRQRSAMAEVERVGCGWRVG